MSERSGICGVLSLAVGCVAAAPLLVGAGLAVGTVFSMFENMGNTVMAEVECRHLRVEGSRSQWIECVNPYDATGLFGSFVTGLVGG